MSLQSRVGTNTGSDNTPLPLRSLRDGSLATSDAHARFQEAVLRGNVYYLSVSAAAPTAYSGAGAGTPLLAIHNPAGSGKQAVLLAVGISNDAAASAAGVAAFKLWGGASTAPTGTKTAPTNAWTQQASGSAMFGFSNTALTGSSALGLTLPVASYYWATAASAFLAADLFLTEGLPVAIPGNEIALGATAALTSATYSAAIYWEEVSYATTGG